MSCRLFIDEVGNDDVNHPAEQYLSLTGIITKIEAHERRFTPEIERLKTEFFGHTPPAKTIVLHRKELMRKQAPFQALANDRRNAEWESRLLTLLERLPYLVTTVVIDKHAHREKYSVWLFNPYHYCMRALLERYVLWLNRHKLTGDVVAEPRYKRVDKSLKRSFALTYNNGTENISAHVIQRCLTSKEIKFEPKESNVCGLQLADLIAHPAHQGTRAKYTDFVPRSSFGTRIYDILERKKFSRNPKTGLTDGWGQKWLP